VTYEKEQTEEAIAAKWDVIEHALELRQHAIRTFSFLHKILSGKNVLELPLTVESTERNRALDPDDTRTAYPEVVRGEYIYFIVFNILPS
jgi:hypothetical protein